MDIKRDVDTAVALHQAGRLAEAEAAYREILVAAPSLADIHYLLGVACLTQGKVAPAVKALRHAVRLRRDKGEWWFNLAVALRQSEDYAGAMEAFGSAVACYAGEPARQAEAMTERGAIMAHLGDAEGAETVLRQALALAPDHAPARRNLATVLINRFVEPGELARPDAVRILGEATQLAPGLSAAWHRLGKALLRAEQPQEAMAAFDKVLAKTPDDAPALIGRSDALSVLGRFDEAAATARSVLQGAPTDVPALVALAVALHGKGDLQAAATTLDQAQHLDPASVPAVLNLGTVLRDLGDDAGAERQYQHALALAPDLPVVHWQRSLARLLAGDLRTGWQEYEWRWRMPGFPLSPMLAALPVWDGGEWHGEAPLLVHAEQGHGDSLQFVRYVPMLAARGIRVLLQVQPALVGLFRDSMPTQVDVVPLGTAIPEGVHWRCPLLGLPLRMGTDRVEDVPAAIPYLTAREDRRAFWRERLASLKGRRVGLVWAGDARSGDPRAAAVDKRRSVALDQLAVLGTIPGISFVSLQKGPRAADCATAPFVIVDWSEEFRDFADTAALVAELDLVIAVDTAVAHLAGALGRPVWVLSRLDGCWRWLRNCSDSPWYPRLRLFRQASWSDWRPTIIDMVNAAVAWANAEND